MFKILKYSLAYSLLFLLYPFSQGNSQTVTNGSVTGGSVGNSQLPNAAPWVDCGGSADLCDISFPSYSGNSTVAASPSPDGGTWAGIASISAGECASTTITGLTVGQSYTLYFCGANFGSGTSIFNGSPATPRVCVGTTCQTYSIPLAANTWNSYTLNFAATATTMTLELYYASPDNFAYASLDGFNLSSPCGNPLPVTTQDSSICQGSSATLTATGGSGTFSWYPLGNSGNIISTTSSVIVSPDSTTSYVVTDGSTNDTSTVTVTPIFADAGNDTTICIGESSVIGGSPSGPTGATFTWAPGTDLNSATSANPTASPASNQLYSLQVDNNSCTAFDSVLISINPDTITFDTFQVCPGEGAFIHGNFETTAGNYIQQYASANGCDSTSNVQLIISTITDSTVNVSICDGESYYAAGGNQSNSGVFVDTFTSVIGCDSIITTVLDVSPNTFSSDSINICQSDSIFIGGAFQTNSGTYYDTLAASNSCDSIHTTFLSVVNGVLNQDTFEICQGDQILIHGTLRNTPGLYTDTLVSSFGCDSVSSIYLNVATISYDSVDVEICDGNSYFAGGALQTSSGTYIDTLLSSNQCDSVLTTFLTVLRTDTTNNSIEICEGSSAITHGIEQDSAGIYSSTYSNSVNCDSLVNTALILNPVYFNSFSYTICNKDSILINGVYYDNPQTLLDTFASVSGCDSVIQQTISIKEGPEVDLGEDQELCEGDEFTIGLDSIPDGYQIIWWDGSNALSRVISQSGNYSINLSDSLCYNVSDSISIVFEDCSFYLFMPNAFSPNGDGVNDIFIPVQRGEIEDYVLRVFDRWGELLFETRNISIGWDGTLDGEKVNPGVYVWSVGYNTPENIREVKSGSLTLLK